MAPASSATGCIFFFFNEARLHSQIDLLLNARSLIVERVDFASKLNKTRFERLLGFARPDGVFEIPKRFVDIAQRSAFLIDLGRKRTIACKNRA